MDEHVRIIGLGYVGLTLAVALAGVGYRVDGVEIRPEVVDRLRRGMSHFHEPGLEGRLRRLLAEGRFQVYDALPAASQATVHIVTLGTPLDQEGRSNANAIAAACKELASTLNHGDLVILRSTVKIGTTNSVVRPILEASGKRVQLAFCPERTVEGQALSELRWLPQIVGADDEATRTRAALLFGRLTPTVIRVDSPAVAEMVKLVDNTYRDVTFAFANEVASLCDAIGISAKSVITACKQGYPRTSLPMPGPVGGPCLEKDPHILAQSFEGLGVTPAITLAARQQNEGQPQSVVQQIEGYFAKLRSPLQRIAILGLAFKGRPATDDLRGTMALPLLNALRRSFPDADIVGFDALAEASAIESTLNVRAVETIRQATLGASLVIIQNNHPVFEALKIDEEAAAMKPPGLIYDFWNHFDERDFLLPQRIRYVGLGSAGLAKHEVNP